MAGTERGIRREAWARIHVVEGEALALAGDCGHGEEGTDWRGGVQKAGRSRVWCLMGARGGQRRSSGRR